MRADLNQLFTPVAMERSRVTLAALIYVLLFSQRRIYGTEIEMKITPGQNITLYCDRPLTNGFYTVWIRNSSHGNPPSLIIDHQKTFQERFRRFSFPKNTNINSFDLHITNITVSDLGLYYCAEFEKKVYKDENGIIHSSDVYHNGNQTTRLSLAETPCSGPSSTVPPPPVPDCFLCWTLFFSVCPVCVLLSSICVYCLCQKKTTNGGTDHEENNKTRITPEGDDDVCYASLDVTTRRSKRLKKKQPQNSDFSTYAPIRTDTIAYRTTDG